MARLCQPRERARLPFATGDRISLAVHGDSHPDTNEYRHTYSFSNSYRDADVHCLADEDTHAHFIANAYLYADLIANRNLDAHHVTNQCVHHRAVRCG